MRISDWSSDVCSSDLPCIARQLAHRVDEARPVDRHHEADRVAVRAAPETVIEALALVHRERRRPLGMERAEAYPLPPVTPQLHIPADRKRDASGKSG